MTKLMEKLGDRYLNEHEVARITGRSVYTLRNDRSLHRGFPYVKISGSVRYSLRDVMDWIEARKVVPHEGLRR